MGCGCCSKEQIVYKNGEPPVTGDVTPCFDSGKLFKIVNGKKWYFFNDTQDCQMRVVATFGAGSKVKACDTATASNQRDDGACTVSLTLMPLETTKFVEATKTNGFQCKFDCIPISTAATAEVREKARQRTQDATDAVAKLAKKYDKVVSSHQLLKLCRKKSTPFVDLYFPPAAVSIYRQGIDRVPNGALKTPNDFCWRRPTDYLPSRWAKQVTLFKKVTPADVDQGNLGDCYFLCACSALAEHKAHLEALFANDHCCITKSSEEKYGGWRVTLNMNGWWRQYVIDSYLPSLHLLPSFARNRFHPTELWPCFLEKAYAKAYGSYQAIVAGFPWEAQEDLTGFPAYCFDQEWRAAVDDEKIREKLFKSLERWSDKDFLISVSTPSNSKSTIAGQRYSANEVEQMFDKAGLSTGHAYTVLNVKHFPLHRLCLLQIRNPWGNDVEWTGDWSDESPKWKEYPVIKMACKPKVRADGLFWMEWKDVIKFFDSGSVCFRQGSWRSTWYHYGVPGRFENNIPNVAIELTVKKKKLRAYVALHQKDRRGLQSSDPDATYASIMVSVAQGEIDSKTVSVITNSTENPEEPSAKYVFRQSRSVALMHEFEENKRYLIVPRRMTSQSGSNAAERKFVLGIITDHELSGSNFVTRFVQLDKSSEAFANMSAFSTANAAEVKTVYQVRKGKELFDAKKGTGFDSGSKVDRNENSYVI